MPTSESISDHLSGQQLDIRTTHSARFMDQKVTPDVLTFVSDCIVNFVGTDLGKVFTTTDIWHSDYFKKNARLTFSKPDTDEKTTLNEYDKFISQPIKMLAYAGILVEEKRGTTNYYTVSSMDLLQHIALSAQRALSFMGVYVDHVLAASGFDRRMSDYEHKYTDGTLTQFDFRELKSAFQKLIIGNTPVKGTTEVNRIFPKVFNVYAVTHGLPGSRAGLMTNHPFYSSDLMYNRVNFRDINKVKGLSRQQASGIVIEQGAYADYQMHKVMDAVRKRHAPNSEVRDSFATGQATQVHHIFPKALFPELRAFPENLILLTPQQHNTKAHPGNNTNQIDPVYQNICLQSKAKSIEDSLREEDAFYSAESFLHVIRGGLNTTFVPSSDIGLIKSRLVALQTSTS